MPALTVHHLRVRAQATAPLSLREYTGASLRGAFFTTLLSRFCSNVSTDTCVGCSFAPVCPVCALVAPLRDTSPRGRDVPRAYAIRPPVNHPGVLGPGEVFTFGLTLFGLGIDLFPYVVLTLYEMGRYGVGHRLAENQWKRGQFVIQEVQAVHLLSGQSRTVMQEHLQQVRVPDMPMGWEDALHQARSRSLAPDRLVLRFWTPLRLTDQKRLVKQPEMRPLVARLLERHDGLAREYGGTPFELPEREALQAAAAKVRLVEDGTRWVDLGSFSRRQRKATPIGGMVGTAAYAGEIAPLLPLLVWGSVIQVGKDTTKGNGVYELWT
jgi:hypothetical protein